MEEIVEDTWWQDRHRDKSTKYLSGSNLLQIHKYTDILSVVKSDSKVLNIGVGTGRCTRELTALGCNVYVVDVIKEAIEKVRDVIVVGWVGYSGLPMRYFDTALCHLVVQHISDAKLLLLLLRVLGAIKSNGIFVLQFAECPQKEQSVKAEHYGGVCRTLPEMKKLVTVCGGKHRKNNRASAGN